MEFRLPSMARMRPPRDVDFLVEQLGRLDRVLQKAEEYGERDPASIAGLQELRAERADLSAEMAAAKFLASGSDGEFALSGEPVVDHDIKMSSFGEFAIAMQQLATALGKRLSQMYPSTLPWPSSKMRWGDLAITAQLPSSFAIRVREREPLPPLYEGQVGGVLDTIRLLLQPGDEIQSLAESVCQWSPEIYVSYRRLLETLSRHGVGIASRSRVHPYTSKFTAVQAAERAAWLRTVQTEHVMHTIVGELVGASIPKQRFEIQTDKDSVSGTALEEACDAIRSRHLLGKRVVAVIKESVVTQKDSLGKAKSSFELQAIDEVTEAEATLFSQSVLPNDPQPSNPQSARDAIS